MRGLEEASSRARIPAIRSRNGSLCSLTTES